MENHVIAVLKCIRVFFGDFYNNILILLRRQANYWLRITPETLLGYTNGQVGKTNNNTENWKSFT